MDEIKRRLRDALKTIPGYGSAPHLESRETWTSPDGISEELILLERPEYNPVAYIHSESRERSVEIAIAFATILRDLPILLDEVDAENS